MTLPTFLGIGVMRGGTTWLHALLDSHPDVYVPQQRKEIFFFYLYYDRGLAWYEKFFPATAEAGSYQALGEITPTYIYRSYGPERIAQVPSIEKLILIVRNPIDRAYSHYGLLTKNGQYSGSFEAFLSDRPEMVENGFYSRFLENYYSRFDKDQILVLVYELATSDLVGTKDVLAGFLGVAAERFPAGAGAEKVNRSYLPKARFAYALSRKMAWQFFRYGWGFDWVVNWSTARLVKRCWRPLKSRY